MLPHWTDDYVLVGEDKFHYTRTGQGNKPPFVLLHGFSDNGLCWSPVAQLLEDAYDVIMPDARGHGLSVRVGEAQAIDNAADAAGIITALGLSRPIVMGHSMGGIAATALGARFPDLVGKLILEDPAWIDPSPDDPPLRRSPFFEWITNLGETPVAEIIANGKTMSPTWPDAEFPAWAASKQQLDTAIFDVVRIRAPWREYVAALTVPTLLITADVGLNAIVTPAAAQEGASLSDFVQVVHIPGAGHNIRRENPAAFIEAVKEFLGQA